LGRFDDKQAALVSPVLTAAFFVVWELSEVSIKNRSVPVFDVPVFDQCLEFAS
jgi:hypothetical protein